MLPDGKTLTKGTQLRVTKELRIHSCTSVTPTCVPGLSLIIAEGALVQVTKNQTITLLLENPYSVEVSSFIHPALGVAFEVNSDCLEEVEVLPLGQTQRPADDSSTPETVREAPSQPKAEMIQELGEYQKEYYPSGSVVSIWGDEEGEDRIGIPCPVCHGDGYLPSSFHRDPIRPACPACDGDGIHLLAKDEVIRPQRRTGALLVQGVGERIPTRFSWQEFKEKFQDPDILSQEDIRFIADLLLWGEVVLFKASLKENASDRWFRVRLYALS